MTKQELNRARKSFEKLEKLSPWKTITPPWKKKRLGGKK